MNPVARYNQQEVTIEDGESLSNFISTVGYRIVGVYVPAGVEGDAIRFKVDPTGELADADVPVAENQAGEDIRAVLSSLPSLLNMVADDGTNRGKIVPGARVAVESLTTGSAQAQTGDCVITLILEQLEGG